MSSGRRGGAQKIGIIRPIQKAAMESDAYGIPKCGPNICSNYDESKNVRGHTN